MADSIHKGHRERVKNEFLQNGFNETTPPHKIIELLLFYSIPQKDTNELAHTLLNEFGSISGILEAPVEELLKIKGISTNTVSLLKLILPIAGICRSEKANLKNGYFDMDTVGEFLIGKYMGRTVEVYSITSFNANGVMVGYDEVGEGEVASVAVSVRKTMETAIKRNAVYVIISHNHPSSHAIPSNDDIEVTKKLISVLGQINVKVIDHIIVSGDDYVSMAQTPRLTDIFKF